MIPKRIHYCWFGSAELPRFQRSCLDSWRRHMPDFEICRWGDDNTDFDTPYLETHVKRKEWAFVSDYVRMQKVLEHGGVYLDTDVEAVRSFEPLLNQVAFLGEEARDRCTTGVFGAIAGHRFPRICLETMDARHSRGAPNMIAPEIAMHALQMDCGDLTVYPVQYFYPYNPYDLERPRDFLMYADVTEETYGIHHWRKSWNLSWSQRLRRLAERLLSR